ncbi:hypothetical protein KOI35_15440 [Actinoplanes bogorensis]|uniref:Uncharacterized protein n=1 Tax=Paractinoplanes bogorensis TaxID=1610840 RepID=A0ABS5YNA3_9ACTN|nr:hypothetical protein [Actinoplanes bogorensis]MBU2664895.1 hypothetical protein [Actinoplanes bogorensis]
MSAVQSSSALLDHARRSRERAVEYSRFAAEAARRSAAAAHASKQARIRSLATAQRLEQVRDQVTTRLPGRAAAAGHR